MTEEILLEISETYNQLISDDCDIEYYRDKLIRLTAEFNRLKDEYYASINDRVDKRPL